MDIPAGTAVRFEPGDRKTVTLTPFGGKQIVSGGSGITSAARLKGLSIQTQQGSDFVRDLLEQGDFAIGEEGKAVDVSHIPKEIEREVVRQ